MSSYLNIYGIPKEGDKPIEIVSFSRSHCVYRAICDEINIAWLETVMSILISPLK